MNGRDATAARRPVGFWTQVGLVAAKDLKTFFLDRSALFLALIFPFVFVWIFSSLFGPQGWTDEPVTILVSTAEAPGSLSRRIIDGLAQDTPTAFRVEQVDHDETLALLRAGKCDGFLFFPEGFTRAFCEGGQTEVVVYTDPEKAQARAALVSVARSLAAELTSARVLVRTVTELAREAGLPGGEARPGSGLAPGPEPALGVTVTVEEVGDLAPIKPATTMIPGYLTMFVFFALALAAETLVAERESSTLERLVAGSATRLGLVVGKLVGSSARGLIQVAVFWLAGVFVFGIQTGAHPWMLIMVSGIVVLVSAGTGVFLGAVARTRRAAAGAAVLVSLTAAAVGGCWWPLFVMPRWFQALARITPHAWAMTAFNKLMIFGATPGDVVLETAVLGLFATALTGLAVWKFRVSE